MERKKEVQSTMIYNDREKSPHTFKYYVFIFIWKKKITSDLIKYKTWLLQTRREKSLQSTWDGINSGIKDTGILIMIFTKCCFIRTSSAAHIIRRKKISSEIFLPNLPRVNVRISNRHVDIKLIWNFNLNITLVTTLTYIFPSSFLLKS